MNMTTSEADLFADMINALSQHPEVDLYVVERAWPMALAALTAGEPLDPACPHLRSALDLMHGRGSLPVAQPPSAG